MKEITIYTKNYCPYCQSAKALLDEIGAEYKEIDITDTPEVMEELVKKSGMMTVPQIFTEDKCLGGYDDIHQLHKKGLLKKVLHRS
jgi:glutaredoxin 3